MTIYVDDQLREATAGGEHAVRGRWSRRAEDQDREEGRDPSAG